MKSMRVAKSLGAMLTAPIRIRRHPARLPVGAAYYEIPVLAATLDATTIKAADIPVIRTPPGRWQEWPPRVLGECDEPLVGGADVYVQTVIRRDLVELVPSEMMQDVLDYHSGVIEAAQTASRVGAKRLALTHMVPAPNPEQYPEWIARSAEHFDGEIVLGDYLTTITI